MASRFGLRTGERGQEYTDFYLHGDPSNFHMNESHYHASSWAEKAEQRDQEGSLREQLKEMDEHVARLQDMVKSERAECTRLQLKCNHQEAELRHRELHSNRLKERLSLLTDRHRAKGPSIDVLNFPPGGKGRREPSTKPLRSTATKLLERKEEAALRLMLERREAELREAMKLRHSLTTLLHALRVDMEQTFANSGESCQNEKSLDQAEVALGEHLTGGVVHSWRDVQKRMCFSDGQTTGRTDQDKLLAQLETELKESQQLVQLQQHLLQDSLNVAVPSELADSYYLEEWERVRMHWAEFDHQRRTFERERQCFTDAAIRLSREKTMGCLQAVGPCDIINQVISRWRNTATGDGALACSGKRQEFEQQKASLVKQQYLCESPENASNHTSLGINKSCFNATPTATEMGTATGRARVQTPTTPELYSELGLPYNSREVNHDLWNAMTYELLHTPPASRLDWSFK